MTRAGRFNPLRTSAAALALCAVTALVSACAADKNGDSGGGGAGGSAEIADRWQQPTPPAQPYRTVFVIGVAQTDETRRLFEDGLVRQLQAQGVRGIPSYGALPRSDVPRDEVVRAVRDSGADGVVVTRLLKREQHHKASFSPDGYSTHYSNASRSLASPQPPVVYKTEVVTLETRLFDAAREQMVWAASTELFDPRATEAQMARLARAIVNDLKKGGLI
jgi:hypothetical protein